MNEERRAFIIDSGGMASSSELFEGVHDAFKGAKHGDLFLVRIKVEDEEEEELMGNHDDPDQFTIRKTGEKQIVAYLTQVPWPADLDDLGDKSA